jgi:hypothetical protein
MGLLTRFTQSPQAKPVRLPNGSFTVDPDGRLMASTIPQTFPQSLIAEIAALVLKTFRAAQASDLPLTEFVAEFSGLKLTARELRGGAIIFLMPRGPLG